jgi:hypothetical protein
VSPLTSPQITGIERGEQRHHQQHARNGPPEALQREVLDWRGYPSPAIADTTALGILHACRPTDVRPVLGPLMLADGWRPDRLHPATAGNREPPDQRHPPP